MRLARSFVVGAAVLATAGVGVPVAQAEVSPKISLTVDVWPDGKTRTSWTVTCQPAGGTHPDPQAACAALAAHPHLLEPAPEGKSGAEQYFGPQRARIRGKINGQRVDIAFSRANTFDNARWRQAQGLFGPLGATSQL